MAKRPFRRPCRMKEKLGVSVKAIYNYNLRLRRNLVNLFTKFLLTVCISFVPNAWRPGSSRIQRPVNASAPPVTEDRSLPAGVRTERSRLHGKASLIREKFPFNTEHLKIVRIINILKKD